MRLRKKVRNSKNPRNLKVSIQNLEKKFRLFTFINTLLPTVSALGLQFLTFIVTARGLGVELFGVYTALLAIVGIGVELVGFGGADLLVRAVSCDKSKFKIYFGNMLLNILITLPLVVGLGSALALEPMHIELDISAICSALFAEILIARISASLELIMVAQEHTIRASFVRVMTVVVRLVAALTYFMFFHLHSLLDWISIIVMQSVLLSCIYIFLGAYLYGAPTWKLLRTEYADGTAFCINQTSRAAQSNLDRMILARFADNAAMGVYGAATRILQLGLFPLQVATRILYPKFFIHGSKGIISSRKFALKVAPILGVVGIFSGLCVVFAATLAPEILGKSFANIKHTATWLAVAMPFIALQYPPADALTGAGRQWLRARLYGVMAILFGFVLVIGAYYGGEDGLILGFVIGHFIFACLLWTCLFICDDYRPKG